MKPCRGKVGGGRRRRPVGAIADMPFGRPKLVLPVAGLASAAGLNIGCRYASGAEDEAHDEKRVPHVRPNA